MHIHTDAISAFWAALTAALIFHAFRGLGGALASRGMPTAGSVVKGVFTFN